MHSIYISELWHNESSTWRHGTGAWWIRNPSKSAKKVKFHEILSWNSTSFVAKCLLWSFWQSIWMNYHLYNLCDAILVGFSMLFTSALRKLRKIGVFYGKFTNIHATQQLWRVITRDRVVVWWICGQIRKARFILRRFGYKWLFMDHFSPTQPAHAEKVY